MMDDSDRSEDQTGDTGKLLLDGTGSNHPCVKLSKFEIPYYP